MILITVTHTEGSVPREAGTWMLLREDGSIEGTLGGGHVEFQAIALASGRLRQAQSERSLKRFALGPSLGQCCGGVMELSFERINPDQYDALQANQNMACKPIALFGGGHVGRAIVTVLSALPYRVTWIDSRDEIFPSNLTSNPTYSLPKHAQGKVICEHSDPVQSAVADLEPGSLVLIMSFSHAEDLEIVQQCLLRHRACIERGATTDLPFIGLIGSKTKWATFKNRLRERGFTDTELAQVTSPIGIAGISGKEPEVIAIAVAAQFLQIRS